MISQSWIILLSVSFFIMTLTFLVVIFFVIFAAVELRKTSIALRDFLKLMDERLKPTIEAAEYALKGLTKVSDDVATVTYNVRALSESASDLATNIRAVSGIVGEVQEGVSLRVLGLRAGVKAAIGVLADKLKEGRS